MRLFIAVRLSRDMRRSVTEVQNAFRRQNVRGNYTPEENLHITLAFIGEYDDPAGILEIMESIPFKEFAVTMDKIGCFGDLWWAGLSESTELEKLVRKLRHALADSGVPYDRKKFRAHITFLRRPIYGSGNKEPDIGIEPTPMTIDRISLMRSTRGKNGMIYTELGYSEALRR